MQICATLVCNTKNSDEQSIICVNYVLRYIADYPTSHQNQNHDRHQNPNHRNHRHDIDHHLNILSGSQYSSVVMASEQVRSSIFSTYDIEKEANASTKSWRNYIINRWTNHYQQLLIRWTNLRCRSRATTATTTMLGSGMGRLKVSKVRCWSCRW